MLLMFIGFSFFLLYTFLRWFKPGCPFFKASPPNCLPGEIGRKQGYIDNEVIGKAPLYQRQHQHKQGPEKKKVLLAATLTAENSLVANQEEQDTRGNINTGGVITPGNRCGEGTLRGEEGLHFRSSSSACSSRSEDAELSQQRGKKAGISEVEQTQPGQPQHYQGKRIICRSQILSRHQPGDATQDRRAKQSNQ